MPFDVKNVVLKLSHFQCLQKESIHLKHVMNVQIMNSKNLTKLDKT